MYLPVCRLSIFVTEPAPIEGGFTVCASLYQSHKYARRAFGAVFEMSLAISGLLHFWTYHVAYNVFMDRKCRNYRAEREHQEPN